MNQLARAMWFARLLLAFSLALAGSASAQSTRIQRYANDFGWTKLANGPSIFQFTATQFPGNNAFSATNCVASTSSVFVGIGNNSGSPYSSQIVRMDPNTMTVQAVISMPAGAWLNNMALSPGKLWASDWATGNVYRVDLTTNTVDLTITTGFTSAARAVVYGNGNIMVADQAGGNVDFYSASTGALVAGPISVGPIPLYGDFDGTSFWIAVQNANEVVKIDGTAFTAQTFAVNGTNTFGVFADGSEVYAASTSGAITVLDQTSGAILNTFQLESGAGAHFMAKVGNELWIAQDANNKIGVIDAHVGTYIRDIPVGKDPAGICFSGYDVFSIDYESGFPPLTGWTLRRHNVEHGIN